MAHTAPLPTTVTCIAENVYQVRIPLPYLLNHVYSYLLRGDDGWTIVDTGLHWDRALDTWMDAFRALDIHPEHIRQIVLTHMHPDHFGLSGWFQQCCHAPVYMTARDRDAARRTWTHREGRQALMAAFLRECGVPDSAAPAIVDAGEATANMTDPSPEHIEALPVGEAFRMGERAWEVHLTPGHSDGHAIFFDRRDGLALSGDHVLMKITPNIGRWPDADGAPLARYLGSLAALADLPVTLALPGHKTPITDWAARIHELQEHHMHRLALMQDFAAHGATVFQTAQHIFSFDQLTVHEIRFAVAETLAHLEHLHDAGVLGRELRDGVWWFSAGVR